MYWIGQFQARLFAPEEIDYSINWVGGWMGPSGGLDMADNKKIPAHDRNQTSIVHFLGSQHTSWAVPPRVCIRN
jgi:hypothetical protein